VIRKHYEKMYVKVSAIRSVLRRLQSDEPGKKNDPNAPVFARRLRAEPILALDG
jgi:hypothetical protein